MQQLCLTEGIILLIDVMSAIVPEGFRMRALDGCWKWHFAFINPVRLLNRRTDHLLVKLLPHHLELGPNDHIVIDSCYLFWSLHWLPYIKIKNVAQKSAFFITTAFCSHTDFTVINFHLFYLLPYLMPLDSAEHFPLACVDFGSHKLGSMYFQDLYTDVVKAFLELHKHQTRFLWRNSSFVNCF